ncbi:MAG: DsrE family protein [Burkholderiales bacterium]
MPVAEEDAAASGGPLRKLCFMVLHCGAGGLDECTIPVLHALTASAMECEVEMHFIGPGVRLLAASIADGVPAKPNTRPLGALLEDARASGISMFACTSAWKAHAHAGATLAAHSAGFAGAATYLGRALDPSWRVLHY